MATANTKGKKKGRKAKRAYKKAVPPPPPPPPIPTGKEGKEKFTFFFRKESPFSQWHPVEFRVDGVEFNCAEQFMMYQKAILFKDEKIAKDILATDSPREHKALGRKVHNFDDAVWKENCVAIVKRGNLAKFGQNQDLFKTIQSTRGTTLVEASPFDRIWGIGLSASNPKAVSRSSWRGRNLLGEILTEVREELCASSTSSCKKTVIADDGGEETDEERDELLTKGAGNKSDDEESNNGTSK